ncbi:MAG: hypothetical protein PHR68_00940 [Candidatus Gracilibacteria bacterium]|nr:hypothetical protein [Candidatus Gracilibacteria bacterium]
MKKQYIFFILIVIMIYLMYLIINYKYKEYIINSNIDSLSTTNEIISKSIQDDKDTLAYLNTESYRNKVLKKEQGLKNKGENVIYITSESQYKKFIKTDEKIDNEDENNQDENKNIYDNMTNFEKWIYFVFKKDIRD